MHICHFDLPLLGAFRYIRLSATALLPVSEAVAFAVADQVANAARAVLAELRLLDD